MSATTKELSLDDTVVQSAGVMRCCLVSVAVEYDGQPLQLGAKSRCLHCKEPFTLVAGKNGGRPVWTPDWQIADPI